MKDYILGLDLGETSVGWAVLNAEDGVASSIIDAGARVFPPGAEVDEKRGSSETANQERRLHRGGRRTLRRRKNRKARLKNILQNNKLLPTDKAEYDELMKFVNPYLLRAKALDNKLEPYELGRTLYHLCQHRGFKSNRKSDDQKESGKVKKGISSLNNAIEESGARTLGEYFSFLAKDNNALSNSGEAIRNRQGRYERHPSRQHYLDEFEAIWEKQKEYYGNLLSDKLKEEIHSSIFFQQTYELTRERMDKMPSRANAWRAPHLAHCPLFPDEQRSPSGTWLAQKFRMLKEINNLKIININYERRNLTATQRLLILEKLQVQKSMGFSAMRKLLKLEEGETFNLEEGKRKELKGNEIEYQIIKIVGAKEWKNLDENDRNTIRNAVMNIEDADEFEDELERFDFSENQIEKLDNITPSQGYLAYSEKAIRILLELMEGGLDEYYAIQQAKENGLIPKSNEDEALDKLPAPPDLPNPILSRALFETRKVVNAIIREYGKPKRIVVELAREVKSGAKRRQDYVKKRAENEARNKVARKFFEERGITQPSRDDLIKFKLWQDQNELCGYSGRPISEQDLVSGDNIIEIDHILPYSRSLDDSYGNKVLCFTKENREKGNKTPYEWLGGPGNKAFDEMIIRLGKMSLPGYKKNKFSQKELDTDKMMARQLVDSQYIAREVTKYLHCLYDPDQRVGQKAVFTNKGKITADLRHFWGMNNILSADGQKNREDHRHHAVDAIVIAATTRKHIKELSRSASSGYHQRDVDPPWRTFRDDARYIVCNRKRTWFLGDEEIETEGILVSHRVNRKLSGGLHKGTNYGPAKGENDNEFVRRVRVDALTQPMIEDIRDNTIRDLVRNRLIEHGIDPDKKGKIPPAIFKEPLQMASGVPVRKVRVLTRIGAPFMFKNKEGKDYRAVVSGNNHHVEIIEEVDSKGKKVFKIAVITAMEAARRARRKNEDGTKDPIVQRDFGEGRKLVMSLSIGEALVFKENEKHYLVNVQKMSGKQEFSNGMDINFRLHTDARKKDTKPFARLSSMIKFRNLTPIKVTVDPIGRIHKAND